MEGSKTFSCNFEGKGEEQPLYYQLTFKCQDWSKNETENKSVKLKGQRIFNLHRKHLKKPAVITKA